MYLWEIKMAGYLHRTATTAYPCYLPILGEFSRSWPYKTCRCKYRRFRYLKICEGREIQEMMLRVILKKLGQITIKQRGKKKW